MINSIFIHLAQVTIGLAGGLAVGSGFVAFLTLLGIIPRLIQLSKTHAFIKVYIGSVIGGTLFGTYLTFTPITWSQSVILLFIWGAFHGIFNGMLAAALAEVLNVFPILFKRIRVDDYFLWLLMAIVFGKIAGSLFQWIILVKS